MNGTFRSSFGFFFRFRFRNAIPVSILTSYPVLDPVRLSRFRSPDIHPISGSPSRRRRVTVVSLRRRYYIYRPGKKKKQNFHSLVCDNPPFFLRIWSAHGSCTKMPIPYICPENFGHFCDVFLGVDPVMSSRFRFRTVFPFSFPQFPVFDPVMCSLFYGFLFLVCVGDLSFLSFVLVHTFCV